MQVAEERIKHKKILGTIARGRVGLGYFPSPQISKANGKERRKIMQDEVRAGIEETRHHREPGQDGKESRGRRSCSQIVGRRISVK